MSNWQSRLKTLMNDKNISLRQLAESIGTTDSAIGHYINGRRSLNVEKLMQVCTALEVSPNWLLFGEVEKAPKIQTSKRSQKLLDNFNALPESTKVDIERAIKVMLAANEKSRS